MAKIEKRSVKKNEKTVVNWVWQKELSVECLSEYRDLEGDIPEYIDVDDFLKFRAYSHALKVANDKKMVSPKSMFLNEVKAGKYKELSDDEFIALRNERERISKIFGDAPKLSILQLCRNAIDMFDLDNKSDRELYDELVHHTFKSATGYDFNEIYIYMNNLSRKILVKPCDDVDLCLTKKDRKDWTYAEWISFAVKDCWENSEGIDLLTLYSRVEKMLPAERTDSFFDSYIV